MCSGCRKHAIYLWIQSISLCNSLGAQKWRTRDLVPLLLRLHPSPIKTSSISWRALPCISTIGVQCRLVFLQGSQEIKHLRHPFLAPFFLGWAGVQLLHRGCLQLRKSFLSNQMQIMSSFWCLWCTNFPPKKGEFINETQSIFQGWLKLLNNWISLEH